MKEDNGSVFRLVLYIVATVLLIANLIMGMKNDAFGYITYAYVFILSVAEIILFFVRGKGS